MFSRNSENFQLHQDGPVSVPEVKCGYFLSGDAHTANSATTEVSERTAVG